MSKFNINLLNDVFCIIEPFFFCSADKVYQCFALEDYAKRKEKWKNPTVWRSIQPRTGLLSYFASIYNDLQKYLPLKLLCFLKQVVSTIIITFEFCGFPRASAFIPEILQKIKMFPYKAPPLYCTEGFFSLMTLFC